MDILPTPAPSHVDEFEFNDDDDEAEGDGVSITGAIVGAVATSVIETVFDDTNDPYAGDEDPSVFDSGGGSFGGAGASESYGASTDGADDSW